MSRNILIVGHSHINALRQAAIVRREADPDRPRTRTIHLLDPDLQPEMDGDDFSAGMKATILDQIERHDPVIASAIGGNGHAAHALIAYERFDFELEGGDSLPIDEGATIRSEAEVREALARVMTLELSRLRLYRDLVGPFWHIESPPPVRSAEWIVEHAEPYFLDQPEFRSHGIAAPGVRYRCWLLASRMVREMCDEMGCRYLPVPAHLRGEAGLLRPSQARDATHGNAQFGEAMLQALEAAAG